MFSDNGEAVRVHLDQTAGLVNDALMEVDEVRLGLLSSGHLTLCRLTLSSQEHLTLSHLTLTVIIRTSVI